MESFLPPTPLVIFTSNSIMLKAFISHCFLNWKRLAMPVQVARPRRTKAVEVLKSDQAQKPRAPYRIARFKKFKNHFIRRFEEFRSTGKRSKDKEKSKAPKRAERFIRYSAPASSHASAPLHIEFNVFPRSH
jgi:hypothetical protein